ncbi:hypothetical protein, partial [Pseudomonas viridiflava]
MTKKSNASQDRKKNQEPSSGYDDDQFFHNLEQGSLSDEIEAELDDSREELEKEFNEEFGDTYQTPVLSLR